MTPGTQKKRTAKAARKTTETDINVSVTLEGGGRYNIKTGIGFFDHMLEQFSRHSLFDIELTAKGDLYIDPHHTVEDCSYALGDAISQALGNRAGITRYGSALLPMDEVLTRAAIDLSNRPVLVFKAEFTREKLGDFDTELCREFLAGLAQASGAAIHIETLYGENDHHKIEAIFKALAHCFRKAVAIDPDMAGQIPSTKGTI